MEFQNQGKIALLIDAENTNSKKIGLIINSVSIQGYIITKRAYGNWTKLGKDWETVVKENAIETIQQFSNTKEKNSSDIALVIDAMDLMYSKKYDTIALISSDSDFTKLIIRIHNEGLRVLGFGEKKTPISLVKACDEFTYIEDLNDSNENEEKIENSEKTVNNEVKKN